VHAAKPTPAGVGLAGAPGQVKHAAKIVNTHGGTPQGSAKLGKAPSAGSVGHPHGNVATKKPKATSPGQTKKTVPTQSGSSSPPAQANAGGSNTGAAAPTPSSNGKTADDVHGQSADHAQTPAKANGNPHS
jgi:hypothetical protein